MTKLGCSATLMGLVLVAAGCSSGGPTTPSARPSASFSVTGIVTDDQGAPVGAATVTIRHWLGGVISAPSVVTDASGRYTIGFTADTAGTTGMSAEIVDLRYERYDRAIMPTSSTLVENFRLRGIQLITAGDSLVLSIAPDDSDSDWLAGPCRIVRVAAPADGKMTVEVLPTQPTAAPPQVGVCCVSGNDVGGNPVTLPVTAGTAYYEVQITPSQSITTTQSVLLKTSLAPL
jgi:hypothetical protein